MATLIEIVIDRSNLEGTVNLVGRGGELSAPEEGARVLAARAAAARPGAGSRAPVDTRLWAALQNAAAERGADVSSIPIRF